MGTRNLTIVISNGKPKVAQYGQWDGYPSGQGRTILEFLTTNDLEKFKKKLGIVRFSTEKDEKEKEKYLASIGASDGWLTMEQSAAFHNKYHFNNRDIGGKILQEIMQFKGKEIVLVDSYDFAADSLFCEWAYVVDFDKGTFEIYKGFNQRTLPKKQRFADLNKEGEYLPVKFKKSYLLTNLPTVKQMVSDCDGKRAAKEVE